MKRILVILMLSTVGIFSVHVSAHCQEKVGPFGKIRFEELPEWGYDFFSNTVFLRIADLDGPYLIASLSLSSEGGPRLSLGIFEITVFYPDIARLGIEHDLTVSYAWSPCSILGLEFIYNPIRNRLTIRPEIFGEAIPFWTEDLRKKIKNRLGWPN